MRRHYSGQQNTWLPSPDLLSPGLPRLDLPSPGLPSPGLPSPGLPSPGLPAVCFYTSDRESFCGYA
jgi:GLTT repeat-containing protein